MHHDDPTREEWEALMWLKFDQRLDVEEPLADLTARRAAEEERFAEVTASLREERGVRVVATGAPTLADRLETARRFRIDRGAGGSR